MSERETIWVMKLLSAMISSTALDLPEHREAVRKACLDAKVLPLGMEQLPARNATGITASLEMVDEAEVFIGIYAFRYGWVPIDYDVSITEIEFDRAVARYAEEKLPEIMVFFAAEDHPITSKDVEADASAQEKLRRFKTRVRKNRVCAEFKSTEDLRRLVLHALHELQKRKAISQPMRTTIPHNLPPLGPFFGREDELAKIADALDPNSRTWGLLIEGPGGMGKTSLAVRAAYDSSPKLFKRIAFVTLKTRELDNHGVRDLSGFVVSGLAELFGELARVLNHQEIVTAAEDQRPRLLLEALLGTQTLLILDNLESLVKKDRDIVITFVYKLPPDCKAVLTSRDHIGGRSELTLDRLSETAALATLAELAKLNPLLAQTSEAERLALYRETDGKPLLLRWTAGQLGHGHALTIADALDYLRSCPEGYNCLEFVFGDLVFSEIETRVLCTLTYFTQPAKVEHLVEVSEAEPAFDKDGSAAATLDDSEEATLARGGGRVRSDVTDSPAEVAKALRSLVNLSLVVRTDKKDSFALVPMVADFLRKKKPEAIMDAGDRLERRAFALVTESGRANPEHFPVLDAAWPMIAATLPSFVKGSNERLQKICMALYDFLRVTDRTDERLALSLEAERKANQEKDSVHAGWAAYRTGSVYSMQGNAAKTIKYAERAIHYFNSAEVEPRTRAYAIGLQGVGYLLAGDYGTAAAILSKALETRSVLPGDHWEIALGLDHLASAKRGLGDLVAAECDYKEAVRIAKAGGYGEGAATSLVNLADLALGRKDWGAAETLAREALPLAEGVGRIGRQEIIARVCQRLAKALASQAKADEALSYARRSVDLFTRIGSPKVAGARETLRECGG